MSRVGTREDLGVLLFRVGLGGTLAVHGAQKLFGWFGGHGVAGTAGGMEAMGFQPPKVSAVLAGLGEAGGGTLLALGLATPVAGAAAAATMVAAGSVHKPAGFFAMEGGYEYNLILGLGAAALAIRGPGRYSIARLLGDRLNRSWLAAAALVVFGAASAVVVSQRQRTLAAPESSPDSNQVSEGERAEAHGD